MEFDKEEQARFYELLEEDDKIKYENLKNTLSSHACRNRRGKRIETFSEMLNAVKTFCIRNENDDWKRCLVCGVCWLPNGIAINTRHLSLLIDKCKSSINGSLQKMGYCTLSSRTESAEKLSDTIPLLKNNYNELREWTVRQFSAPQATQATTMNDLSNQMLYNQMLTAAQIVGIPTTPIPMIHSYPMASPLPTVPINLMNFPMTPIPAIPVNPMLIQQTPISFPQLANGYPQLLLKPKIKRGPRKKKTIKESPASDPVEPPSQSFDKLNKEVKETVQLFPIRDEDPFALTPSFFFGTDRDISSSKASDRFEFM